MHTLFDLTGKTALITGASSGLGEGFARILSSAGARVILAARRLDRLKTLAGELKNAFHIEMDVSNQESVRLAFDQLERAGEKIDICVNNAGIALETSVFDQDDQGDFECTIQTNLMGVWYVTKAVADHMRKHNIHGSIINIGSINGDALPGVVGHAYNASKAAVMQLTKGLVGELAPYHIRVNTISPGFFVTEMTQETLGLLGEKELLRRMPLGFVADPSDMAGTILYLASDKASRYVTGACLTIDGGSSWDGWG